MIVLWSSGTIIRNDRSEESLRMAFQNDLEALPSPHNHRQRQSPRMPGRSFFPGALFCSINDGSTHLDSR